ncbi:hypothetical protein AAHB49_17130 [Bacillus cereus]
MEQKKILDIKLTESGKINYVKTMIPVVQEQDVVVRLLVWVLNQEQLAKTYGKNVLDNN